MEDSLGLFDLLRKVCAMIRLEAAQKSSTQSIGPTSDRLPDYGVESVTLILDDDDDERESYGEHSPLADRHVGQPETVKGNSRVISESARDTKLELLANRQEARINKLAPKSNKSSSSGELREQTKEQKQQQAVAIGSRDQLEKSEEKTGARGQRERVARGRGLLETLLGERGKSWLEQRTVVLDIRNDDNGGESNKSRRKREEKWEKSEESGAKLREVGEVKEQNGERNKDGNREEDDEEQIDLRSHSGGETSFNVEIRKKGPKRRSSPIILSQRTSTREAPTGQQVDQRVPCFGAVPQKITRLPYYSYYGKERNVTISSATDRPTYKATSDTKGSGKSGSSSAASVKKLTSASTQTSSSSTSGSESRTSGQLRIASDNSSGSSGSSIRRTNNSSLNNSLPAAGKPAASNSPPPTSNKPQRRAFSNISNLFPRGTTGELGERERKRDEQVSKIDERLGKKLASAREQQLDMMNSRRRNSFAHLANGAGGQPGSQSQPTRSRSNQSIGGQQQQYPVYGARSRQMLSGSQSGSGTVRRGTFGSGTLPAQRRPVSSSALYSPTRSPTSMAPRGPSRPASSAYRYYDSQYRSALVDPDCPVHGTEEGVAPRAVGVAQRRPPAGQQAKPPVPRGGYLDHAVSQPDLLYNDADEPAGVNFDDGVEQEANYAANEGPEYDDYQGQNNWRERQQYYNNQDNNQGQPEPKVGNIYRSPQVYSPLLSPNFRQSQRPGSRQQWQQSGYLNSSSRFSLYHPSSEGLQSSLAPTSEQLRRILGYKPPLGALKPVHLHPQWAYSRPFIHLQPLVPRRRSSASPPLRPDETNDLYADASDAEPEGPRFWPFNRLQDSQAIRSVDFHPSGEVYAIGSNSRALRICAYPAEQELRHFNPLGQTAGGGSGAAGGGGGGGGATELDELKERGVHMGQVKAPNVLFKFLQIHRGSIYCVRFNPNGQLLATGSNDQTVHLVKYNPTTHNPDGDEFRLTMHNGTVRDLCFIDDSFGSGSSLLLSAGGGDNKIYVTDCDTVTPYQSMAGHTQMVMALNHCGGAQFASGSYDKTIRFWDLRTRACTSIVSAPPQGGGGGAGAPISSLQVDQSGRLLASGHTDSTCMLYDIRGGKIIQTFRPHDDEIRAISFSPKSYYLLTGSYDGRLVVSDLQGDLTRPLPSACVAECEDKIVQAKWHPSDFTFVSTSADKSATLWALPGDFL